jgi:hypothetical protein
MNSKIGGGDSMYRDSRRLILWWSALLGIASVMVLVSTLLLYTASNVAPAAADTEPQRVTDARAESEILTRYALDSRLRSEKIAVFVIDGSATLEGSVANEDRRALAEGIALRATGIRDVTNRISLPTSSSTDAPIASAVIDR